MRHTFTIQTNIPVNRRIELLLPLNVPTGEAEVKLVVVPKRRRRHSTGKDLLASPIFGMWADRTDIDDSAEYARELRERAWRRAQ